MRNSLLSILRHAFSTALGGLIVAAILLAPRAFAQDETTVATIQSPTIVDEVDATEKQIAFQGLLLDRTTGRPVADGNYQVTFRIWDNATGGGIIEPPDVVFVDTTEGMFTVLFTLDSEIVRGQDLWIGTQVGTDPEGVPRQKITYVPYAMWARNSDKFSERGSKYLPIAWGIINEGGSVNKAVGVQGSSRRNDGVYELRLADFDGVAIDYNLNDYVTVVTPITQSNCPKPTVPGTNSFEGLLLIEMDHSNGNNGECKFHFITYKP